MKSAQIHMFQVVLCFCGVFPMSEPATMPTPSDNTLSSILLSNLPETVTKRSGTLQPFDLNKIRKAIAAAWSAVKGEDPTEKELDRILFRVIKVLSENSDRSTVGIEQLQDAIEVALMGAKKFDVAKGMILYRQQRADTRGGRTAKKPDAKAISDYIHAGKYARYRPELRRREVYSETVDRVKEMHQRKFPQHASLIEKAFQYVHDKKVLPSMRSMQFGGRAMEEVNNRGYNCMGVETEFITTQGVKKFSDFKDGDRVTVLTHTGAWKSAIVKNFGTQKLFEYTISRGRSSFVVRATRDHEWILSDGSRTRDLSVKNKLHKAPRIVGGWDYYSSTPEERYYWALGYVYGDGTLVKDRDGEYKYSLVRLCGADKGRFLERFRELGFSVSAPASFGGDAIAYTGKYLKTLPSIEKDGFANVVAFVRGYLDADGHKNENGDWPSPFNGIQATGGESIDFIRSVFPSVGAYITKEDDLTGQETNFGIRPETSRFGLVLGFGDSPASSYSVQGIKEVGYEEVWCLEVDDDHSFVLPNGIVTGNCSFTHIDRFEAFSEAFYLLLCGCGVGYSIQKEHVEKLQEISYINPKSVVHHVVEDTIEGWAEALRALINSYLGGYYLEFSYYKVREAGASLVTSGGKAPGHLALKRALERVRQILNGAMGRQLRPAECHRILCHTADAVLSGGIRRSAMIALFSFEDTEMLGIKTGNWFENEPWLQNANNSVVLHREDVKKKQFKKIFQMSRQWGEPGFYFTANYEYGTNPCCEIGLNPVLRVTEEIAAYIKEKKGIDVTPGESFTGWAFCNLCELNAAKFKTFEDFKEAAWAATVIGTLQATYTSMPYLGWVSEVIAEWDALLGIGMTGMMDAPEIALNPEMQQKVAEYVVQVNREISALLGIRAAARTTCVKPSGTTSLELGCVASGHHTHHGKRFFRRVTGNELEPVFQFFKSKNPHMCVRKPNGDWVIEFVVEPSESAIVRKDLTAIDFLKKVKSTQTNWVLYGENPDNSARSPGLHHNVSNTVTVQPGEWDEVSEFLWSNREFFTGVSFLAASGDKDFAFAPNEEITTEGDEIRWNAILESYVPVDYSEMVEEEDSTNLKGEAACAAGGCEVKLFCCWHGDGSHDPPQKGASAIPVVPRLHCPCSCFLQRGSLYPT